MTNCGLKNCGQSFGWKHWGTAPLRNPFSINQRAADIPPAKARRGLETTSSRGLSINSAGKMPAARCCGRFSLWFIVSPGGNALPTATPR
jgi:hypothetical protein